METGWSPSTYGGVKAPVTRVWRPRHSIVLWLSWRGLVSIRPPVDRSRRHRGLLVIYGGYVAYGLVR